MRNGFYIMAIVMTNMAENSSIGHRQCYMTQERLFGAPQSYSRRI